MHLYSLGMSDRRIQDGYFAFLFLSENLEITKTSEFVYEADPFVRSG